MAQRIEVATVDKAGGLPWWQIFAAGLGAILLLACLVLCGRSILAFLRRSLVKLGLSSEIMARSLALGLVIGVMPMYVPIVPTLLCTAVAKLLGMSIAAAILGLNLSTPFWLTFMVPYIRAGEMIGGKDALAIDRLLQVMQEDPIGAIRTFGGHLLLAMLVWGLTAPVLLTASYIVFRPICRAAEGEQVCCLPGRTAAAPAEGGADRARRKAGEAYGKLGRAEEGEAAEEGEVVDEIADGASLQQRVEDAQGQREGSKVDCLGAELEEEEEEQQQRSEDKAPELEVREPTKAEREVAKEGEQRVQSPQQRGPPTDGIHVDASPVSVKRGGGSVELSEQEAAGLLGSQDGASSRGW